MEDDGIAPPGAEAGTTYGTLPPAEDDIVLSVLGPVGVRAGGAWRAPRTPQQRLVLGLLAVRAGQIVPVPELIDGVWDDRPPGSARGSLQSLVTRLRQVLAPLREGRLERCGDGYRLRLGAGSTDLERFRALARAGRAAGVGRAAVEAFDRALALWRGPALADVPATASADAVRSALAQEHFAVISDRIAGLLACGMEREAAAELPPLLALQPLSEQLAGMLMVSRYRLGQRADALHVFRDIRGRLASELGVEPGPELQRLHQRILAGDAELAASDGWPPADGAPAQADTATAAAARRVIPRQLPAAPAHLAGRAAEIGALNEMLAQPGPDGRPAVWVISGTAGVGKTALAVHWAHRVANKFPDGQLYLDLRGFGPSGRPVTAGRALYHLLQSLGIPSARLPHARDPLAALYRTVLAGQRVLILLDNVATAEQVRPLLPASPGCAVLVTSRSTLSGLVAAEGARLLTIDVLAAAGARELLVGRLGAERVRADAAAAAELARLCAGLPLALAIAAARAAARPGLPLRRLVTECRSEDGLLDALRTPDEASSVREVLSWSRRQLSPRAARMFVLLATHPGPDISAAAAASLACLALPQARRTLAELTGAHLAAETAPGRFAFHDLLRAYAGELALASGTADGSGATRRVLDHYLVTANTAAHLLYPARDPLALPEPSPGTAPERPRGRAQAQAWFAAEHQVLLAVASQAATAGFDAHAWQLAASLLEYLDRQGHWHDLAITQQAALAAAERAGDSGGQAHARHGLAVACLRLGRRDAARGHLERAISLFQQAGDKARLARSQIFLGTTLGQQGHHAQARRQTGAALRLYQDLGHLAGQAHALTNLGWHSVVLADYQAGLDFCQQALGLHRQIDNLLGQAHTWDHLGYLRDQLGEHAEAIACYRRALYLLTEVGDRSEEAAVLTRLGDAHRAAGDRLAARDAWRRALAVLTDLHHPDAGRVVSRLSGLALAAG
jgi:DNA-binding SARP family transcriptional activator/tetratricopeptide (TPR) repeat protein